MRLAALCLIASLSGLILPSSVFAAPAQAAGALRTEVWAEEVSRLEKGLGALREFRGDVRRTRSRAAAMDGRLRGQAEKYRKDLAHLRSRLDADAGTSRAKCREAAALKKTMAGLAAKAAAQEEGIALAEGAAREAVAGDSCSGRDLLRIEDLRGEVRPVMGSLSRAEERSLASHKRGAVLREEAGALATPWAESGDTLAWTKTEHQALLKLVDDTGRRFKGVETSRDGFRRKKAELNKRIESAQRRHRRSSPETYQGFEPRYARLLADASAVVLGLKGPPRDYKALREELKDLLGEAVSGLESLGCRGQDSAPELEALAKARERASASLELLEGHLRRCGAAVARDFEDELADQTRLTAEVKLREAEYEVVRLRDLERDLAEWKIVFAREQEALRRQQRMAESMKRRRKGRAGKSPGVAPASEAGSPAVEPTGKGEVCE